MKYKLIKRYPSLSTRFKVGDVVWLHTTELTYTNNYHQYIPKKEVEDYPEFWAAFCFITNDGLDMFEGDEYYAIQTENTSGNSYPNQIQKCTISNFPNIISNLHRGKSIYSDNNGVQRFSSKEAAEKWIEEQKPKFEIGEWYYIKNDSVEGVLKIQEVRPNEIIGEKYLIKDVNGVPEDCGIESWYVTNTTVDSATPEQIEKVLIAVAKHKGFKEGIKFKSAYSKSVGKINEEFSYNLRDNRLYDDGVVVYNNGNWAEIIEEHKATFGGKEVTFKQRKAGSKVFVCRNGDSTPLSKFQKLYDSFKFIYTGFKFRGHDIENIGEQSLPDSFDDMTFSIGCTEGTISQLKNIIEQGLKFKKNENKS